MNQRLILLFFAIFLIQASHAASIPSMEEYLAASKEFDLQKAEANTRQSMPRIEDKRVATVFAVLFDDRILTARRYSVQDMDTLLTICGKANEVSMSYILFDLKNQITEKNDPIAAAAQIIILMGKNSYIFQDEVAMALPFLIRCAAVQLPLLTQFLESLRPEEFTDVRREGALQFRNGIFGMYGEALTSTTDQRIKEGNLMRILSALADTSSTLAESLPEDKRKLIADFSTLAIQSASEALRKPLLTIQRSMQESSCSVLCKL